MKNLFNFCLRFRQRLFFVLGLSMILQCFFIANIHAQEKETITVSGIVKDAQGEPILGVNIWIEGTGNGTITDNDGKYRLSVYSDDVMQFSFIGFKQKSVPVNGQTNIDVVLEEDIASLDEVVVVGYGAQKSKNITGAIATIPVEQIENLPVSNLTEALRGQIPGLSISGGSQRPGESATMTIRQTFGFSKDGNSEIPLIVIDDMIQVDPETGLPSLDAFNRLDPSEIESITVLKDGSAAIYGSRASQGAVIVKTKRGKAGKTRFNYSGQLSFNDAISHSKTMSAYDFGVWHNRFLKAGNRDSDGKNLFSDEELEEMKGLNYDWLDKAWSGATQQKHSLNMSGGNENATYFAGATYYTQGANLGSQDYDKWNFRVGLDAKITKDLNLSASVSANSGEVEKSFTKAVANINDSSYGSKAKSSGEQADYGYLLHMPQYIPWQTTIDGEDYWVSPFPRTDRNLQSANTNRTIAGWNYFATLNNGSKQVTEDFLYNANFALNYNIPFVKGLSVKGTFSRSQSSTNTEQVQLPYTLARIKNYNQEDHHLASAAEEGDWKIEENKRNSRVYYNKVDSKSTQANFFINYSRTFGDHEIDAMASVERSESNYNSQRLAYENTSADYLGTYETAGELSDNSTAYKGEAGTLSYLGRLNYSYRSKYLFQFIFRSDASTKFAPENYWGFFPSVQLGWVMSEEDWFANALPWVDFLKLRYSIGKTGKDNIKPWRWMQLYDVIVDKGLQFGSEGGHLGGSLTPRVTPNRDAAWDTCIKHDVGLDVNVLDNRLKVGFDFYYDRTKDMFTDMAGQVGVPISVGGGYAEENYATVDAWGTEYNINWSDKIGPDFSYNIGVQFGSSNNKIKKYPEQSIDYPSVNRKEEGGSLFYPVWGFETWNETSTGDGILRTDEDIQNYWNYLTDHANAAGTDPEYLDIKTMDDIKKGMLAYKDIAGFFNKEDGTQKEQPDGKIVEHEDYIKLVDKNKTHGFTTNIRLKYKGISFSTQISTSWGGYRSIDLVKQGTSSSHNMWAHESYWTDMYDPDDNVNGKYPNLAHYDVISAPSNFWKLNTFRCYIRNLSVGYDIPKNLTSKVNIEKATIGITGNNLWDFYNPYPDHYRNMYDNSYVGYPTLRTWAINLNVSF
jgi:TonB-linked SusC/RagA family outer membrane protein